MKQNSINFDEKFIPLIKEKNNSYSPSIFPSFERKYAKYSSENQE